jgi:hypothetical protein
MLSDSIHDIFWHPPTQDSESKAQWFLEDIDHYSKEPFSYDPEHLKTLRNLCNEALLTQTGYDRLFRSAIAFMRFQDTPPSVAERHHQYLIVKDGELILVNPIRPYW